MNYWSKVWMISFFMIVLSSQIILGQEETPKHVQASISKTVEAATSTTSPVYGPISIKLVNESVIGAIKKVAVAARLKPVFDYDLLNSDKKVNLTLEVASLSAALDQILLDMDVQYSISESGLLVLTRRENPNDQPGGSNGSGTIKGAVLDKANGEPLVGANVVIQNTSLGIAADIDGKFEIKFVPVGTWKVKVSCIGYQQIIREVMKVLEAQGIDIDIRHILLVADTMTMSGHVQGISRYGIVKDKPSVLARASFETPLKHIVNAATIGEADELNSVIENVMLNQPVPVGTGLPGLITKNRK